MIDTNRTRAKFQALYDGGNTAARLVFDLCAEIDRLRATSTIPAPELAGSIPMVLYFKDRAAADEFVAVVREVNPNLVPRHV